MHKITMLGTGLIGMFYTMSLHGNRSRDQVKVIYSRTPERAQQFAGEWNIPRWTTDLAEAINDPETDVVVIGLPNNQHEEAVQLAAQAGKAVLCTKPLARTAAAVLDALEARMPFPIRAISVDNGSEFMADFEAACAERSIRLFVLPPRSPKLHGSVERANRTHTEEFYEVTDAPSELEALAAELAKWEVVYNTIRPHQGLGYLTPAEFLASLEGQV